MKRFIILIGIILLVSPASAAIIYSTYTTSPPTIDGVISPGEWGDGMAITLNGFYTSGNTMSGHLYVLNCNSDLYVAIVLDDSTESTDDWVMVDFDQGHDHTATTGGEDSMDYYYGAYVDYYWDGEWWAADIGAGGTSHGSGARGYSSSQYTYEFTKPLDSGEGKDISLAHGDTVGFRIETWDHGPSDHYRYPQDTVDSVTSRWDEWADLVIASATATTTSSTTTVSGDLKGDTDGNGTVSDFELLNYIDLWTQGTVGDFDLLEAIDNWSNG